MAMNGPVLSKTQKSQIIHSSPCQHRTMAGVKKIIPVEKIEIKGLPPEAPGSPVAAKKPPAATADNESESIPCPVVIRSINSNIISEKHYNQVDRGDNPMPQTAPESIGLAFETFGNHLLIGTT